MSYPRHTRLAFPRGSGLVLPCVCCVCCVCCVAGLPCVCCVAGLRCVGSLQWLGVIKESPPTFVCESVFSVFLFLPLFAHNSMALVGTQATRPRLCMCKVKESLLTNYNSVAAYRKSCGRRRAKFERVTVCRTRRRSCSSTGSVIPEVWDAL